MDLRRELHRLLEEGRSDEQIVDYMVDRYGDFILYRPRFNQETALLWFAPVIFLLLGVVVMVVVFYRQKKAEASEAPDTASHLDSREQAQLENLLNADSEQEQASGENLKND